MLCVKAKLGLCLSFIQDKARPTEDRPKESLSAAVTMIRLELQPNALLILCSVVSSSAMLLA